MTKTSFLCAISALFVVSTASAQDFSQERLANWHQWRGPEANGSAPLGDPPSEWNESKNVKWKVPVPGRGNSTPIIWGDRIFLLAAVPVDQGTAGEPASASSGANESNVFAQRRGEQPAPGRGRGPRAGGGGGAALGMHKFDVICLDRSTGNTLWRKTAREIAPHEGHHNTSNFAPSSPVTDGEKLYVSFGSRGLYCYDLNGNQLWSKDLGQMQIKNTFGEGASPAVHGNTLVVNWDHEGDSFIVALDASTGDQKWRQPRDEGSTWATPLIVSRNGRVQVITNGQNRCRSYDLATGELIWECGGQGPNPIPSPVLFEDKAILMTGFRTFQAYAIPLDATGDITDTDKIDWKLDDGTPYVSSPLLYGGTLYFTKERSGLMTSVDADTGQIKIRPQRLPNVNDLYASPVGAAEKVYFSSREGRTVVLKHAPELEVLAVNELDGPIDASPAIVGKEMFIRTATHLYCIAEAP